MKNKEELVTYLDEKGEQQEKWFEVIDRESRAGIRVKTSKNIITIPHHKVIRIKEKGEEE